MRFGIAQFLVLGLLHLVVPPPALAARFLHVQIERDGAVILESGFGAGDEERRERLWGRLLDVEFEELGAAPLAAGKQELALQGDLRITIRHVDRELVSVQIDKLQLRRAAAGGNWRLPPEEVERAALQAGLDVTRLYPPQRSRCGPLLALAAVIGGGLIALALGLLIFWMLRRSGSRQPTAS
jgi:hypothetical protein